MDRARHSLPVFELRFGYSGSLLSGGPGIGASNSLQHKQREVGLVRKQPLAWPPY